MSTNHPAVVAESHVDDESDARRYDWAFARDVTLSGDSAALADEAATLTIIVHALRALRPELDRAASIDALDTPASYRAMLAMFDALTGDAEGMLDTREWHDVDRRTAA